jgi:FixJ family two-component response regulator
MMDGQEATQPNAGGRKIVIDPVTRVEGHGKVTIRLNEADEVEQARFHIVEFRGFERFIQGRTARRIHPNAILADLMTDAANHGATLPERLHAAGLAIPIYIVTSGSDAVLTSIGLHELGVAGVFLKPADPGIIIATLKTGRAPHVVRVRVERCAGRARRDRRRGHRCMHDHAAARAATARPH